MIPRTSRTAVQLEQRHIERKIARHRLAPKHPRPYPSHKTGYDTIPQIKHVIVLMMENHSFDNYFATLDREGVDKPDLEATNAHSGGELVQLAERHSSRQFHHLPTQSWHGSHLQWGEGRNDGFVTSEDEMLDGRPRAHAEIGMKYWTAAQLPFYHWLAETFPVADHWFCSCLGPTFPNRRFLVAGTAHGLVDDLPFGMVDVPRGGTIFDVLTENNIDWANYHSGSRVVLEAGRLLGPVQRVLRHIRVVLTNVFPRAFGFLVSKLQFTAALYPLKFWSVHNHVRPVQEFFKDAANGELPPVSIVDPDFRTYSEENPQDIQLGEGFAAKVIGAAMSGRNWSETLLVWTYDEHGGYYDHVQPPEAPPPDDIAAHSILSAPAPMRWLLKLLGQWTKIQRADEGPATYDVYGFRVPAVIVSPYSKKGFVSHQVYDHTSILKFIEEKWNLPALTDRDYQANDFMEMLDLKNPPFLDPPTPKPPARSWTKGKARRARLKAAFR